MYVRPSFLPYVRMEQFGSNWTVLHDITYFGIFWKYFEKINISYKCDKNDVNSCADVCTFMCRCMCIYVQMYVHLRADVCTFMCRCLWIYVQMYVHLCADVCTFMIVSRGISHRMRNVSEKIKTHLLCSRNLFRKSAFYEIMCENMAQPEKPRITI